MRPEMNDFAIVSDSDKRLLVQVVGYNRGTYTGIIDNEWKGTSQQQQITFEVEDILAILPPIPTIGKVFNVKVEPWLKREIIQPWGEINYHRHMTDAEINYLRQVLGYIGYILQQVRITGGLPISIQIRNKSTHMDGYYRYTTHPGKSDILCLCPESITEDIYRMLYHEFGHHIWYRLYGNELRAQWINLYHQTLRIEAMNRERLQYLYQDFTNSSLHIGGYRKYLKDSQDDNGLALFNLVLTYFKKVHRLSTRHVEILHVQGDLANYWPKNILELSKVSAVISDYGTKNAEEFHSEAFAFACINSPLPQNIIRALTISLQKVNAMLPALPRQQSQMKAA